MMVKMCQSFTHHQGIRCVLGGGGGREGGGIVCVVCVCALTNRGVWRYVPTILNAHSGEQ